MGNASAAATNLEADTIAIQLREFRNLSELTDSRRIAWTPDQSRDCLRNRFNIRYASNDTYQPENEPIEIPKTLKDDIKTLLGSVPHGDDDSTATSCKGSEMLLLAAKKHLMQRKATDPELAKIKIERDLSLIIRLWNYNHEESVNVKAYVDWGYSYGERDESANGIFFAAANVKSRAQFEGAEIQLVTYLAILQQYHRGTGTESKDVRGFLTDGYRYRFMAIKADKEVISSPIYNIHYPREAKIIFNHVYAALQAASKSHSEDTVRSDTEGGEPDNHEDEP